MTPGNENLWAPWRMEYIRSLDSEQSGDGCFLCRYAAEPQDDRANFVVVRTATALLVLNRFPYTNGHLLVAPIRHVPEPSELSDDEWSDLNRLTTAGLDMLRSAVNAQGFNVGLNLGRCAGAGLPDHIHQHVVPRWSGDTNYMAVLGGIRVIPDALEMTYDALLDAAVAQGLRSDGPA